MVLCLWHIQCYAYMCNYKCAFANSLCMYMAVYECLFGVFYLELMTDDNVDSQGESKRNWFIAKKWCQTWADIQIFISMCETTESHISVFYAREIHARLGKSD